MNAKQTARRNRSFSRAFESLEDRRLMASFAVTSHLDSGANTLRWAIAEANATPGADTITFNLPTASRTITLTSALPAISDPVTIDGTTQPGYTGAPRVEITGNNTLVANGLVINANNSVVRGLAINGMLRNANFQFGRGIVLNGSNNVVEKNYLGLRLDGVTTRTLERTGVDLIGSNNTIRDNAIGGAVYGVAAESGSGANANNNVITGNFIGTIASGMSGAASTMIYGVTLNGGNNNRVGGPAASDRNVIAIGTHAGIYIGKPNTTVQNNIIGFDVSGSQPIASGNISSNGIHGYFATDSTIRDNLIANAGGSNVLLNRTSNITIVGNRIGLTSAGAPAISGQQGVYIEGSDSGLVTIGTGNAADRNWIMGGSKHAIFSDNAGATLVRNNVINIAPNGAVGNTDYGVRLYASGGQQHVGGTGANEGNFIAGARVMIALQVLSASDNQLTVSAINNQLGMTLDGTAALGSSKQYGVLVEDTDKVLVQANRIANVGTGIYSNSTSTLQGNQIGLDAAGLNPIPVSHGIEAYTGKIGGNEPGQGNLIGRATSAGISLVDGTQATIQGNRIGMNAQNQLISNSSSVGILVNGHDAVRIGGTTPGTGNVIVGMSRGIEFKNSGSQSFVQGNTIGLPGMPNGRGIDINASNAVQYIQIGGDTEAAANVIAHNNGDAIRLTGEALGNVSIRRNSIHGNAGMPIELMPIVGVTPNDALDADTGANGLQNFPLLFSADSTGGAQTTVQGLISSSPSTPILVDFYSADTATDARVWLGSRTLLTDSAGAASFTQTLPFVPGGKYIVASATNVTAFPYGATSEFSPAVQVTGPADTTPPVVTAGVFEFETGQRVKLTFSEELLAGSIAANDLQMKNNTTNQTFAPTACAYDAAARTVTFSFKNALTDGNYTWTLPAGAVSDLAGNATASPFNGNTHVLAGDANRDKAVNFDDLLVLSQNYGTSGKTFGQGDFNYDGKVDFDDLLALSQRYGKALFSSVPVVEAAKPATPAKPRSGMTDAILQ